MKKRENKRTNTFMNFMEDGQEETEMKEEKEQFPNPKIKRRKENRNRKQPKIFTNPWMMADTLCIFSGNIPNSAKKSVGVKF